MVGSLPTLIDFYHEHPDDERFAIIAFHNDSVKTLEELDTKLRTIREKHWGGRALPFTVLLDSTGDTIKRFGIRGYPTSLLLDPEGRLVARGDAVFDGDGKLLADGPADLLTKVLKGTLRVDPHSGRLIVAESLPASPDRLGGRDPGRRR